jgi:hypothetical protein
MSRSVFSHWSEFDAAVDRVLGLAQQSLLVFDFDLAAMKLNQPGRIQAIERLLVSQPKNKSIFVVQDASRLVQDQPRLMRLLDAFQHNLSVVECADSMRELTDSMLIADAEHAVVRFHRQQARCKLLENEPAEVQPYVRRFNEILAEGGHAVSARATGL